MNATPQTQLSQRADWATQQAISFLMQQAVENPHVISLAAGLVDSASLPVNLVADTFAKLLARPDASRALQYGTTLGAESLRREILSLFARLENSTEQALGLELNQVVLTTGSQQFLSLICDALLNPDDICLVAGPTYFVFCGNLNGVGARTIVIPSDEHGMRTDLVEAELARLEAAGHLPRVKLIYSVSYYENPTGISLSNERRSELVAIARRWSKHHRIHILEDAAYREMQYDGAVHPSVWSFDETREQVIYTQTFSKSFSPGVRVAFAILPKDLVRPIENLKGNVDFGSPHLNQQLMTQVLQSGQYESHVAQVCTAYRTKRDAMLAAASQQFGQYPEVTWVQPHGGLYVWMTLPAHIQTGFESELFKAAVAEGVMYVPGELCYGGDGPDRPRSQMRLSFGVQPVAGIHEGITRLARAYARFRG